MPGLSGCELCLEIGLFWSVSLALRAEFSILESEIEAELASAFLPAML